MSLENGCEECYANDASDAWDAFKNTEIITSLIDESHFSIRIRKCLACHQHYLSVFTETIDWKDGEDPQLWSVVPTQSDEIAELSDKNEHDIVELVRNFYPMRKSLCLDWPKGTDKKIFWRHGIIIGLHD